MPVDEIRKRILLVDDDETIVETVGLALRGRGYEVLVARDGSEGLMRAERDDPDLIILDIVMPRRSGFAVLNTLRNGRFRSPPIIMVTASSEPRHRDFARARGADAFLPKPFGMDELLMQVEVLLGS